MSLTVLPGYAASHDLFDVLNLLKAEWTDAGIDTEVLIGERHANDEGAGNRVVFVPSEDINVAESGVLRLEVDGRARLQFGCSAYVWGPEFDSEIDTHRGALAIVYNILATLPNVSGDRVYLVSADRSLTPTQVDYGHQYKLSFYLLYQVNEGTKLTVPPKPYAADITANPRAT